MMMTAKHIPMACISLSILLLSGCSTGGTKADRNQSAKEHREVVYVQPAGAYSRMVSPYLYWMSDSNEAAIRVISNRLKDLTNRYELETWYQSDASVLVSTMVNLEDLDSTSGFGRLISEQYSAALSANNITVKEIRRTKNLIEVEPQEGEFTLSRHADKIAKDMSADYILTGVYRPMYGVVYVNVKLIATKNNVVVESVDYGIPINDVVRDLLRKPYRESLIKIRAREES